MYGIGDHECVLRDSAGPWKQQLVRIMRLKNAVLSISTISVIVALASSRSEAHHGPSVEPFECEVCEEAP